MVMMVITVLAVITAPRTPATDEPETAPAVKAWLENVLIPALVKRWVAVGPGDHGVNSNAEPHDAER